MLDFATSIYDWYDAKSGKSKPEVKAGAFATLMLHLGLADKVGDRLVMKPQYENDTFSLTMLRNGGPGAEKSHYKWISGRGRHKDLNGDELKKFFEEHVEVKVLDTTKWEDRASDTSDNIIEECLEKYGYSDMDAYIQRARWNLLNWISRMER